jgi:mono/diheme cytochrome c family protein
MRMLKSTLVLATSIAAAGGLAALASCGSNDTKSSFDDTDVALPERDEASSVAPFDAAPIVHDDFKAPVFADGAPANAPQVFALADTAADAGDGGASTGGPCLYEPEIGTLFPSNWLRPRFRFAAAQGENLFEIKMVVPNQVSPLVIYTTKSGYTLDKALWQILTSTGAGTVHLSVRSAVVDAAGKVTAGPFAGTAGDVEVAPPQVQATGSVLYWTTSGGTVLKGFKIGDETVQPIITPAAAQTQCVACHTSTPDGLYAGLTGSSNANDGTPSSITIRSVDGKATEPPFLSASAKTLLGRQQYAPTFSKGHWQDGDHTMLTMLTVGMKTEIAWTDLEATSTAQGMGWDVLARGGDVGSASSAVFAHDGTKLAYVSTSATGAGVIATEGRIFTVPYANRAGGASTPVAGASDGAFNQYYPTFSADDQVLAFNRVATGASSYNDTAAEVFVVPSAGGTATRLAANDPPACLTTKKSPGITNSWPKWAPEVRTANGKSYYFLVFSSTRNPASNGPQLYVAPIVIEGGKVTTYAALTLWNQPETENNHTPAWDVFQLPGPK